MEKPQPFIATIERLICKHEEETYHLEVFFDMPENTEELHVEMDVQPLGDGGTTIDLGLKSPLRVQGWSGGARKQFFVGKEKATPGYLPGELIPGKWAVLIGAYRVPAAGCRVTLKLTFRPLAPRWLSGDLHTHSVHSDGTYSLEEAGSVIEALGCDFIAATDHNTVSQNFALPQQTSSVVFIPGMELTTNRGHANILGVCDPLADFRVHREDDVVRHLRTAMEQGATIVLNHTHCDDCPWEWSFDVPFHAVEVWNGPWTERNYRALQWWHAQLSAGNRIVAVGGSDVHRPHDFVKHAMPATWVFAASRTGDGILQAIRRGNVFISYAPDGPTIEHNIGAAMIGDTYAWSEENDVLSAMRAAGLSAGDLIKIISERGVEQQFAIANQNEFTYTWQVERRLFYRIEIWRYFAEAKQTCLAALSNPVYIR